MNAPPFAASIRDIVPLGPRFLLSVSGASVRPQLPCRVQIGGTPDILTLLELVSSPTLWLLGEVTLVAELEGGQADINWRGWVGRRVAEVGRDGL